ncbi:RloB family protein [Streptomyces sp. NPDC002793]|uniref:RloB family protein n=1 Tax=Streptomyces sp. NPDC002793 TaxID=3154432 RepID=UPI00332F03C6
MSTRGGQQQGQHDDRGQVDEPPRRKRKSRKGEGKSLAPPEPPPPEDTRAQRVLYIGCEGESTEPDYLNYLNERFGDGKLTGGRRFKIWPVYTNNGYTPARAVAAAQDRAGEDEAWALFDRDGHHDIADAVKLATEQGTEVCFSHPSFELWLLLHFQDFSGRRSGKNKDVVEALRKADPAYAKFDDRGNKSIKDKRRTALDDKESGAVSRARRMVKQCEHDRCEVKSTRKDRYRWPGAPERPDPLIPQSGHAPDCPVLDRDPSTDVWRLLVSLEIVDA